MKDFQPILTISCAGGPRAEVDQEKYEKDLKALYKKGFKTRTGKALIEKEKNG